MEHTIYPPLYRGALRLNGIFGVTWQLYKRSFRSVFPLTLLCLTLPMLLIDLLNIIFSANLIEQVFADLFRFEAVPDSLDMLQALPNILSGSALSTLFYLAYLFLLAPAYNGALYLEMDQCMDGKRGTFGQLLRYALPIGFKQMYTTYLSYLLVYMGISFIIGILSTIFITIAAIGALPSLVLSPQNSSYGPLIALAVIFVLIVLLALIAGMVFIYLIYPVSAHERKRAFAAVSRAFQLSAQRFWRMLGVLLLYMLILVVIVCIIILVPALLLFQNIMAMAIVIFCLICIFVAFAAPYSAALATALYVDASARNANASAKSNLPPAPPAARVNPPHQEAVSPRGPSVTPENRPSLPEDSIPPSQLPYFTAQKKRPDDNHPQETIKQ